jgi:hypothetical protein
MQGQDNLDWHIGQRVVRNKRRKKPASLGGLADAGKWELRRAD